MKESERIDLIINEAILKSKNRKELWIHILNKLKCKNICEIGVYKGDFAEELLNSIKEIETYTLIDPWEQQSNWNKPANVSNEKFNNVRLQALKRLSSHKDKIIEIKNTTKKAVKEIKDKSIDFAYIDGDHTLRGITIDLDLIFNKVIENGFIGGDDCLKNIWQHSTNYDPTLVFPYIIYFAESRDLRCYILPFNQFIIYKGSNEYKVIDKVGYMKLDSKKIFKVNLWKDILLIISPNWFLKYIFKIYARYKS